MFKNRYCEYPKRAYIDILVLGWYIGIRLTYWYYIGIILVYWVLVNPMYLNTMGRLQILAQLRDIISMKRTSDLHHDSRTYTWTILDGTLTSRIWIHFHLSLEYPWILSI